MKEITKHEKELKDLLSKDKSNWARFYILMKEVEDKELYKQVDLKSFTAWVKDFAMRSNVHESILWNRKKAGKVYEIYKETQEANGKEVPPIENATVSMDSLVLVDKIAKKSPELGAELIDKAVKKQITRDDLRVAYKTIRDNSFTPKKSSKSKKAGSDTNNNDELDKETVKQSINAIKIIQALKDNHSWLGDTVEYKKVAFKSSTMYRKYRLFTEFPVYTGTSKKSRRIDALVVENVSIENHYEVNLHGIEIKVSKGDLLRDTKYTEYTDFVNYMWLAVPEELLEVALENVPPQVGILTINEIQKDESEPESVMSFGVDTEVINHRDATRIVKPKRLVDAMQTVILRSI